MQKERVTPTPLAPEAGSDVTEVDAANRSHHMTTALNYRKTPTWLLADWVINSAVPKQNRRCAARELGWRRNNPDADLDGPRPWETK